MIGRHERHRECIQYSLVGAARIDLNRVNTVVNRGISTTAPCVSRINLPPAQLSQQPDGGLLEKLSISVGMRCLQGLH